MGRLGFTVDDLSEDERRLYERLGPLMEEERLRMAPWVGHGAAVRPEGV